MKKEVVKNLLTISIIYLVSGLQGLLLGQATSKGDMPQYLFSEFTKGEVLMKAGQVNTSVMNYNTVTEKMVFITNDKYYDMTNPEMVDTVFLNGCKFVPVGKAFYEVLVSQPITLFIQHKGSLLPPGKPVGYGGTSQTASASIISSLELSGLYVNLALPNDYIVNPAPVYWIRAGDKWSDFINEKQFIGLFPDHTAEIKSFIKENRIKIDKPDNLSRLVRYCSSF